MQETEDTPDTQEIKEDETSIESEEDIQHETRETIRRSTRQRNIPDRYENYYVHLIYSEAINGKDSENWKAAIQEEKGSFMKNKTWIEPDSNQINDKRILNARWIFKIKEDG